MTATVCVASGPSFTEAQAELIRTAREAGKCRVIVVNRMWERFPDADVLYAADAKWWRRYWLQVEAGFRGECWTCNADIAREFGLCSIKVDGAGRGLSRDPSRINSGNNGGFQLVGLAYSLELRFRFGLKRILLAGYDMQGPGQHSHDPYPEGFSNAAGVASWVNAYPALYLDLKAVGIPLINCSLATALSIPRGDLATELNAIDLRAASAHEIVAEEA